MHVRVLISATLEPTITRGTLQHLNCAWDTNFVVLSGHMTTYGFLWIPLAPDYIFSDEIKNLTRIYMLLLIYILATAIKKGAASSSFIQSCSNLAETFNTSIALD